MAGPSNDAAAFRRMRLDRLPVIGDDDRPVLLELKPENPRWRGIDQPQGECARRS